MNPKNIKFRFGSRVTFFIIFCTQITKMLNKNIIIAIAVVLAIVCLAEAREEGPHDMADALRMLQELDRYYTQAARPRLVRPLLRGPH